MTWIFIAVLLTVVLGQCPNPLPNARVASGFCASIWAASLSTPRGLALGYNGDILVVESGTGQISALWEENGSTQKAVIASASGLNHGILINSDYLYASSQTTLYRWRYTGGRTNLGTPQVVINSIPSGGHVTRTPVIDSNGLLYISVGSQTNIDRNSQRARVVRFDISNVPSGGIDWNTGFVFADGLRNEVGLAFDADGQLWGVENGCDNLNRADIGGDIHINNPSEEVNLFNRSGAFYGYPYCWTELDLAPQYSKGIGSQWAHPDFIDDGTHTDAWCSNTDHVVRPVYNMQAHTAPLDIKFYSGTSFPTQYRGGAFVTQRGSWNRQPPAGYRVIYLTFQNGIPVSESVFLSNNGASENWPNNIRPVAMVFSTCGGQDCLFISSDVSGHIIRMFYTSNETIIYPSYGVRNEFWWSLNIIIALLTINLRVWF